jgi:hypothetical protein
VTFAVPPDFQATYDASRHQDPSCPQLGAPRLVDQNGALICDPVTLAALAASTRGLNSDRMIGHVAVGLVRKGERRTQRNLYKRLSTVIVDGPRTAGRSHVAPPLRYSSCWACLISFPRFDAHRPAARTIIIGSAP